MAKQDQPHTSHRPITCMAAASLLLVTACGSDASYAEELSAYRTEMESFFNELQSAQNAIDTIDVGADSAETDLLTQVDAISVSCTAISSIDPPAGCEAVQDKAEHAAAMMGLASNQFHDAFESTDLDQDAYDAAMEYYKSAGDDIQEMIVLLQTCLEEQ